MEVKEAIEFIKYMIDNYSIGKNINKNFEQVISLLQQGEAYRQIVEGLKYSMCRLADYDVKQDWLSELYKLEQKYLKEANPNEAGKAKDNRK